MLKMTITAAFHVFGNTLSTINAPALDQNTYATGNSSLFELLLPSKKVVVVVVVVVAMITLKVLSINESYAVMCKDSQNHRLRMTYQALH